jgi:SAM-dependent methyltransferase
MANDPVTLCLAGEISPPVMLARMVLQGASPEQIVRQVAVRREPRARSLLAFAAGRKNALGRLSAMLKAAGIDHSGATPAGEIAAMFDAAVAAEPEASVALYSLGDPELLAAATGEVVTWLLRQGLAGPDYAVLDVGCGIGRIAGALAPHVRSVLGVDISPRMIAEARRRYPDLRLRLTSGEGLEQLADSQPFGLILIADAFPYLLQASRHIARQHIRDAARLLAPGGALVIINLSYGPDPAADEAAVSRWAAKEGLRSEIADGRPFNLWDGAVFVFRRGTSGG